MSNKDNKVLDLSKRARKALRHYADHKCKISPEQLAKARVKAKVDKYKKYGNTPLQKLQPWHNKALERLFVDGLTLTACAEEFNVTVSCISQLWRSRVGLDFITELQNRADVQLVKDKIKLLSTSALRVLEDILMSDDPDLLGLKKQVATDLLDRAGALQEKESKVTYEHIFRDIRDSIEQTSKRMKEKEDNERTTDKTGTA